MKMLGEKQALLVAIVAACVSLLVTLGIALALQPPRFSTKLREGLSSDMTRETYAQGRRLFLKNCAGCHGVDARGNEAPGLRSLQVGDALIRQVIAEGIKGAMPSYDKKLSESDVRALTVYLRTLRK